MTGKERINKVIETVGISKNAFAKSIGYATGQSIYNIFNGKRPDITKLATKISNTYPQFSISWIMFEEGNMLREGVKPKNNTYIQDSKPLVIEDLNKEDYSMSAIDKLLNQNAEILKQNSEMMITINKLVNIQDQQTKIIATNAETINILSHSGSKNVHDVATPGG